MKIALATAAFLNNETEKNMNTIKHYMKQAKAEQVELLLFGESFLQGFDALTWNPDIDKKIAISQDHVFIQSLKDFCRQLEISLGFGYMEKSGEEFFCSYIFIDYLKATSVNYRRLSEGWRVPQSDDTFYKEGDEFKVFDYKGYKTTIGLCGDLWTPEVANKMPADVEIVIWPNFFTCSIAFWEQEEFAAYVNHAKTFAPNVFFLNSICNDEGSKASGGAFAIIDGQLKHEKSMGEVGLLTFEI